MKKKKNSRGGTFIRGENGTHKIPEKGGPPGAVKEQEHHNKGAKGERVNINGGLNNNQLGKKKGFKNSNPKPRKISPSTGEKGTEGYT